MDIQDINKLINSFLDIGEMMLDSGGEINRVEDTLSRLCRAYGAEETNIFAITSAIIITAKFPDENYVTHSRRIYSGGNTDFKKLDSLNSLSRECSDGTISPDELGVKVDEIKNRRANSFRMYAGSALASGAFAIFFGGTVYDGVVSAVFGLIICLFQRTVLKLCPNKVFFYFLCSFVVGFVICMTDKLFPAINRDLVMIGDIMLLIPGVAITNAMRDIIIGDTVSGITKLTQCLLWAGALAGGFMLAISLSGGVAL